MTGGEPIARGRGPGRPSATPARSAHGTALACVLAAEAIVFLAGAHRHYAWAFPQWNDQTQYLGQAYEGYELARHDGLWTAVQSLLHSVAAQGCLHAILALPVFAVAGPTRTGALAVNMLALVAWQAATFLCVLRVSGRRAVAWASVGLLLALHYPWSGEPGSAIDFRLDLMAACAYGVTLAAALAGRGFRSTGWALALGAAVGATVLLRFLTVVYFGLIFLLLLAWLLTQRDRLARCARLALSGLVAFCLFGTELLRNRATIYAYYWMGHYAGPERALRESGLGAVGSLRWIFSDLLFDKLGVAAILLGLLSAAAFLWRSPGAGRKSGAAAPPRGAGDGAWAIAVIFFAAPAAILAAHPIKTQPPESILIPGAVWIMLLAWTRAARGAGRGAPAAIGAGAFLAGASVFIHAQTEPAAIDAAAADFKAMNGLSDYLFFRAEEAGLDHPRVAVNWILGGADAPTFRLVGFERHGRMLSFEATLPTGIFSTTSAVAMNALANSDFVGLATRAASTWPFDREMAALLPAMQEWCDLNMTYDGRVDTARFSMRVYEKRSLGRHPGGVQLESMVSRALKGPGDEAPLAPAAPFFTSGLRAVGSVRTPFRYQLSAAYSPVVYRAAALPAGLTLDSETGEIRGRLPGAGVFRAQVSASNPSGATSGDLEVHVEDSAWFALLEAPVRCRAGAPVDFEFGAFDEGGTLDFIDVADLTARKTLARLAVPEGRRQSWSGTHTLTLVEPGPHLILMRFARFDPGAKEPYSFVDRTTVVTVEPGR